MASHISVGVFLARTILTPKRLSAQSLHDVKTSAVFLLNAPSGLNIGRFVVLSSKKDSGYISVENQKLMICFCRTVRQPETNVMPTLLLTKLQEQQVVLLCY